MQVRVFNQSILGSPDWKLFLQRSSLMIAAVLLGSALIMAIAANWLSWPKIGRIALLQVTITALVVLAWWSGQRKPKDWASAYSLSSISLNLAAIAVGGLLALIGQSYQTGADPWQLFAVWAVLLLPWVFAVRSLFIILLVLTITNIALYLYLDMTSAVGMRFLFLSALAGVGPLIILFNALALALSHRLAACFHDPALVVRRVSMLYLVAAVLWWQWQAWFNDGGWAWVINLMCLGGMGALAWLYLRRVHDVLTGAIAYIAVYILAIGLIIYSFSSFGFSFFGLFYACALIGGFLIYDLRRMWRQRPRAAAEEVDPSVDKEAEPWFLRVFYLGAQAVATFLFLLSWVLTIGEPTPLTAHIFVVLAVAAIVYFQRIKHSSITQDVSLFLLMSMWLMAAVGLGERILDSTGLMLWFMALSVLVYVVSAKAWLVRYFSAAMASMLLVCAVLGRYQWFWDYDSSSVSWLIAFAIWLTVALAAFIHHQPQYRSTLMPLWSAWLSLILFWSGLMAQDQEVFYYPVTISAAILPPLVLGVLLWSKHSAVFSVCSAIALGVLSWFWLYNAPLANFALVLWVWAYAERQRSLFWFAALLLLAALGLHYYELQWLLIHKAIGLAAGGAWLACSAWCLRRLALPRADSAVQTVVTAPLSRSVKLCFWLGLLAVLGLSTQDVYRKEHLLATGSSVILPLAPVDPRSLMQGDFMALNFALGEEVRVLLPNLVDLQRHSAPRLLAYLTPSTETQSTLVALQNAANGHALIRSESGKWIYVESMVGQVPVDSAVLQLQRKRGNWLPNGVDAWFFPEGQAAVFEQARYGEFKTNAQGKALLLQLLDDKAQPVAAPAAEQVGD